MIDPNFIQTELPSVITEWAVPLASQRGSQWWASGTAVIVGPYLAITARHVIDDHWQRHQGEVPGTGEAVGEFSIVAFQVPEVGEGCLWAVRRIWPSPHTDVAFLKLVPWSTGAASYVWRWATINVLPPAVGSRVAAFGYYDSKIVAGNPVQWPVFESLNQDEPPFAVSALLYKLERAAPAVTFAEMIEGFEHHVEAMRKIVAEGDHVFREEGGEVP